LGVMGFDIAFLYAMKGFPTLAYDASGKIMDSFSQRRNGTIERLEKRQRISQSEKANVLRHLQPASEINGLAKQDLVTEAVFESAKVKTAIYRTLKENGFTGVLTTNTSSLTRELLLNGGTFERKAFATTHFFNPVLHTRMVELVRGDMEEGNSNLLLSFLEKLERAPVETRDISGFVSNSVLMYYAVMALRLLESGARIDTVDHAAKAMGLLPPFISFDSWKPSIVEDVTRVMYGLRGDDFLRSSKLLANLATDNPRFYIEQTPNPAIYQRIKEHDEKLTETIIKKALKAAIHIAAARVVELGESPDTVDFIAVEGIKIPEAPLEEIDKVGPPSLLQALVEINRQMPEISLTPPELLKTMTHEGQTFFINGQPNRRLLST